MNRKGLADGWMVGGLAILVISGGCTEMRMVTLGQSVQGRLIECQQWGQAGQVVLIMATIHGDESAGTLLIERLARHLAIHGELLDGRRVLLIPVSNPDGLAEQTRHNASGVDLNRNFPADNFAATDEHGSSPLCEPESRALFDLLNRERPDRIVTLHEPLACIDYDGPAEALAEAMGGVCDLPVKRLGSRPGSLGSYAGLTLGIPIVTLELPKSASQMDRGQLWEAYGAALLAAIRFDGR